MLYVVREMPLGILLNLRVNAGLTEYPLVWESQVLRTRVLLGLVLDESLAFPRSPVAVCTPGALSPFLPAVWLRQLLLHPRPSPPSCRLDTCAGLIFY